MTLSEYIKKNFLPLKNNELANKFEGWLTDEEKKQNHPESTWHGLFRKYLTRKR